MMKKFKVCLVMFIVMGLALALSLPAHAGYYNVGGRDIMMDGYFRQEFAWNPNSDSPNNYHGFHTAYSILYADVSTEFSRSLEARMILRLWADMAYALNRGDSHWDTYFRDSQEELMFLDNFDDIVREVYVTYTSSRFQVRVGRQQIGWGESDGLRLMDVINPLDIRKGPFYDTQGYSEVRVPKWLLKTEIYPDGIGDITDVALQLIWNPGDIQEQQQLMLPTIVDSHKRFLNDLPAGALPPGFSIDEPTAIPNEGGVWAIPTPAQHGLPFHFTYKRRTDGLHNSEFGARLSYNWANTFMTLNYWNGIAHEHLFEYTGLAIDPVNGNPVQPLAPGAPLIVTANLIYPRVEYAGITANREVEWIAKVFGINTNPIIRFEGLYSFDQKINSTRFVMTPMGPSEIFSIVQSDQIRYMVGFDWPVRIKWLNAKKNIFLSGQFFHIYTKDMPSGNDEFGDKADITLDAAPYKTLSLDRNQTYCTLLMMNDYMNDKLTTSALYVQDLGTGGKWVKTEVGYKIGDHWRPSVRYLYVDGAYQTSAFALYKDRDEIALRIEYQF